MNPYQVMAIIVGCTVVFAGVVTALTMQGVPLLLAFLGVYLVAVWVMIGMQKRAREFYDGREYAGKEYVGKEYVGKEYQAQRYYDRKAADRRVRIKHVVEDEEDVLGQNHLHA